MVNTLKAFDIGNVVALKGDPLSTPMTVVWVHKPNNPDKESKFEYPWHVNTVWLVGGLKQHLEAPQDAFVPMG